MNSRISAMLVMIICIAIQCTITTSDITAEELDKAICLGLKKEKGTLVRSGIPQTMKKGHDWAQDNLDQTGLNDIKRYIYIEEQLLFRCPTVPPMVHPNVKLPEPKKVKKKIVKKLTKPKKKSTKTKKKN